MSEEKSDNTYMALEARIVEELKGIYDPEIPVNIYDLGLIYEILVDEKQHATVNMTLTAPNCPIADGIVDEVTQRVKSIEEVSDATVNLVFAPPWTMELMSEEAKLELGFL